MLRAFLTAGLAMLAAFTIAFVVVFLWPEPALAQTGGALTVPWGDWTAWLLLHFGDLVIGAIGLAFAYVLTILPAPIRDFLRTMRVDQILAKAVAYGIESTAGAAKGQTLTVHTGSAVMAAALTYVIDKAPAWLLRWMGGEASVREMILARLNLEEIADGERVISLARQLADGRPLPIYTKDQALAYNNAKTGKSQTTIPTRGR